MSDAILVFTFAVGIPTVLFVLLLSVSRGNAVMLTSIAVFAVLAALSFALRSEARLTPGVEVAPLFASVALIWLAWVLVLVLVVRALCIAFPTRRMRRVGRALGAMGTTVPWFGFATAQMMVR